MEAFVFTSGEKLKSHPDYTAAKSGDTLAAVRVIKDIVDVRKGKELIQNIPAGTFIVPIAAEEMSGNNQLPIALSSFIAALDDTLIREKGIVQTNKVKHTGSNALDRLLARPEFWGTVHSGSNYFIVDDLVTSGSSINELRHFIENKGGRVIGAAVLASAFSRQLGYGANIDIQEETIQKIIGKFDEQELNKILAQNGIANNFRDLTNGQARYLTAFSSLDSLRTSIAQRKNEAGIGRSISDIQRDASKRGRKR